MENRGWAGRARRLSPQKSMKLSLMFSLRKEHLKAKGGEMYNPHITLTVGSEDALHVKEIYGAPHY